MTSIAIDPASTLASDRAAASSRSVFGALSGAGALLVLLGATLGPLMMFDSRPYSEIAGTTAHLVHYAIWAGCLIALSQIYSRLGGMAGASGRRISPLAATAAAVGVTLDACSRFVLAFVNPMLATHEPYLLDTAPDAVLLVPLFGAGVVAMAGTVWLAVSGRRAGVFPRTATVLLVVGALAIPVVGPLSNVLVGAALVWIGISARRRG